ncbi:PPDK_N domain-containing protein [Caerostris extrusa]|uniref:PPDK_N domain-containing protein n=1 Tax=Caerostris extrusa TaxID=172846 RepID=A0AAV4U9L0_CAEEX|nr:PPDK_N domain-containing protein [Caerostris extrusa]
MNMLAFFTSLRIKKKKSEESIENILSQLNVPLSFISKWYLRFTLPNCRRGVRAREFTKSITTKAFDYWRRGYRHLGKLMVSEGRIPDEGLVFFLTLDEIHDLLNTRSLVSYQEQIVVEGYIQLLTNINFQKL